MIVDLLNMLRKWRQDRLAIEALSRLNDQQLTGIGLTRGLLEEAIRSGRRP